MITFKGEVVIKCPHCGAERVKEICDADKGKLLLTSCEWFDREKCETLGCKKPYVYRVIFACSYELELYDLKKVESEM